VPGLFVNGFLGPALQQFLNELNLKQIMTYETFDNSTEEQEIKEVKIRISYLPND
jgi:hypothetical protein